MIPADQLAALPPARRAEVIYAEAQSALSTRLWRAALGDADRNADRQASPLAPKGLDLQSLIGAIQGHAPAAEAPGGACGCGCACACSCHGGSLTGAGLHAGAPSIAAPVEMVTAPAEAVTSAGLHLGANARYAPAFAAAEARTGIPASALAAIVDAEAAKTRDGGWNPLSRNPRSSAAGLGQFLSGTWQDLAQTPGTWLNTHAAQQGWLDGRGKIAPGNRADLLALRYDPQASILGVADLARLNLDRLEKSGIRVRTDGETLAKAAYLSHHLGLGDARRFLGGGIDPGRARVLLTAQIGGGAADQRIAAAGDAARAHRQWLLGFIEKRIRPQDFIA